MTAVASVHTADRYEADSCLLTYFRNTSLQRCRMFGPHKDDGAGGGVEGLSHPPLVKVRGLFQK